MIRLPLPTARTWMVVLALAGVAANGALTCGASLVAFALIAALTLSRRVAVAVATLVWLESQVLGFGVFDYPRTHEAIAGGVALGVATVVATLVTAALRTRVRSPLAAAGVAFAAYELTVAAALLVSGGSADGFSPAIVGELALDNALVAVGLGSIYFASGAVEFGVALARRAAR